MALPKNKSRKITVDDIGFRYGISTTEISTENGAMILMLQFRLIPMEVNF